MAEEKQIKLVLEDGTEFIGKSFWRPPVFGIGRSSV